MAAYKPARWRQIPAGLKYPDGYWFTIHSGTAGLFVNRDALGKKPVPGSWKDLLDPMYTGMVDYLDPTSAAVGYTSSVAINEALGWSLDDFSPVIEYFKRLQENQPIFPKQTSHARVISGEIPILFDYEFNAYRGRYKGDANAEFVIPSEGTLMAPYVMSLVRNSLNTENGKRILDFVLSDKR